MHQEVQEPRGLRILVVDDNHDIAWSMKFLLQYHGHRISTAHNGLDAVRAATRERYDVVLLDLHMPVMNGFQAAAALRHLQPAPVLIACSSCDDADARRRTADLGFSAHLSKPVPLEILHGMLGRILRGLDDSTEPGSIAVAGTRSQEVSHARELQY